jgi:prephenate dehydrogenase
MIKKICICGVGLIGGSFAASLKANGFMGTITGFGRNRENLQKAVELNIIDNFSCNLKNALGDAELIILASPMLVMPKLLQQMKGFLSHKPIISDVGSVKGYLVQKTYDILGDYQNFVPAHPIAGKEKSGIEAIDKNLFIGKKLIITPTKITNKKAIKEVQNLWQKTGAIIKKLTPTEHDKIFAHVSHLPHMLAFSLINTLDDIEFSDNIFAYAAGGFADFTRIGASDPIMWSDICMTNKKNIIDSLEEYIKHCKKLQFLIKNENKNKIKTLFAQSQKLRQNL